MEYTTRKEAKRAGEVHFVDGIPCIRCQVIGKKYTSTGTCIPCAAIARDKSVRERKAGREKIPRGSNLKPEWCYGSPERAHEKPFIKKGKTGKNKFTRAREALYMNNPKKKGETVHQYLTRLLEDGKVDALSAPAIILKLLDKEVGNAPTVQLTAELSDTMSDEELAAILKKAGIDPEDETTKD